MAIKILNWNVEQFGIERSANLNRLYFVCKEISDNDPDIASIIEIKTTKVADAVTIANRITYVLQNKFSKTYHYILSYSNKLEIHLFLYNNNTVRPICIGTGNRVVYTENGLQQVNLTVQNGVSTTQNNGTLSNYFPLIQYYNIGSSRPPAVGFFWDLSVSQIVTVLAWHNMAGTKNDNSRPVAEMDDFNQSPFVANQRLTVQIANNTVNLTSFAISGDFNVDYINDNGTYNQFTGFATAITVPTILQDYSRNRSYNKRADTVSACFDNFIYTGFGGRNPQATLSDTINECHKKLPARAMTQNMRGFSSDAFLTDLALSHYNKYIKNDDNAYFPPESLETLQYITFVYLANTKRVNNHFLDKLFEEFAMFDVERGDFDDYINSFQNLIDNKKFALGRMQQIAAKSLDPNWGDALFIHHEVLSDHMPVILTLS